MSKSKRFVTIGMCFLLFFMTLFVSVGYASVAGTLTITGSATYKFAEIYILSVSWNSDESDNYTNGTPSVTKTGLLSMKHNNFTLNAQTTTGNWWNQTTVPGGWITLDVTVRNDSGFTQYFKGYSTDDDLPGSVSVTYTSLQVGESIPNNSEKTFKIKIQNSSTSAFDFDSREGFLEFSPALGEDEDFSDGMATNILTVFSNVLANLGIDGEESEFEFDGRRYSAKEIVGLIQSEMTDVSTGGYTGNVGAASDREKELMNAIFGEHMKMQIGSHVYEVSFLIKNQEINGDNSKDMVMYFTPDQLDVGGGTWSNPNSDRNGEWENLHWVPIYAAIFINNGNGNGYTYCEHTFVGKAPVCDKDGKLGTDRFGNLHTNLWLSTEFDEVTDDSLNSGDYIGRDYITTDGELDDAYDYYIKNVASKN